MIIGAGISDHDKDFRFKREPGFPYWTFSLAHSGNSIFESLGQEIMSQPFDLKFIKPNTPYATRIVPGGVSWRGDWLIAEPRDEWLEFLHWPSELPGIGRINVAGTQQQEAIKKEFRAAVDIFITGGPLAQLKATHALESVILLSTQLHDAQGSRLDARIIKAIEKLSQDFDQYLDVDMLAESVDLSPSRFAHLFKSETGQTPMAYRESVRLNQAKQMLIGTNWSVQEIAEAVFYESPFHFSKRFKQRFGYSPRKFRQMLSEPEFLVQFQE